MGRSFFKKRAIFRKDENCGNSFFVNGMKHEHSTLPRSPGFVFDFGHHTFPHDECEGFLEWWTVDSWVEFGVTGVAIGW